MRLFSFLILSVLMVACENSEPSSTTPTANTEIPSSTPATSSKTESKKTIVFFGDSITAAYGLEEKQGYTSIIQNRIDNKELDYKVVNAGLSGETTAAGVGRINWVLKQAVNIFVLELGGNDALRGISPEESYKNLSKIADAVLKKYPKAQLIVAGMEAPPNMGKDYTDSFRGVFKRVATEKGALLIPFLLENVGGIPELNLPDGIHPTAEGHQIVADNIWKVLEPIL